MVQVQIKREEMIWYVSRTEFISFLFRALQSILEEDSVVLVGQAFRVKRQTTEGFEILTVTCRPSYSTYGCVAYKEVPMFEHGAHFLVNLVGSLKFSR